MMNIHISRYSDPKATGWAGCIQPQDRSWIAFIGLDGRPLFFLNRDPVTGAIISDDPTQREVDIAALRAEEALRAERALHTGVELTEADTRLPGVSGKPGEIIIPLGVSGNGGVDVESRQYPTGEKAP